MPPRALIGGATLVAALAGGVAPPALRAQDVKRAHPATTHPPRVVLLAPDGHPDLQGIWVNNSATPLQRPDEVQGRRSLTKAEVADLNERARQFQADNSNDFAGGDAFFRAVWANGPSYKSPVATGGVEWQGARIFDDRTALIIDPTDGRLPAYTPEGQQRVEAENRALLNRTPESADSLSNYVRCLTSGTPRLGGLSADVSNYYQIVQTSQVVVVFTEAFHNARVIALDGRPHLPQSIRQLDGDSRGRWEGPTLVIDTTNFSPHSHFLGAADHLHVIERLTRLSPDVLNYEITVEDSTTWSQPWTALVRLGRTRDHIYEFACHEGNSESIQGILKGTAAEREATGSPR
jgi:hypothetical protein